MDQTPSSDVAFSESVKSVQRRRGSRAMFERLEARGGFHTSLTADLEAFLAEVDTAFLATASAAGQPYVQHRGGAKGFIRVLGPHLLGFADYTGNRQFITLGNLAENGRALLFLIDYARRRRVKIWAEAEISTDPALVARLMPPGSTARAEQAILLTVTAWDMNCPQHIPAKRDAAEAAATIAALQARIDALEAANAALRAARPEQPGAA